MRISIHPLACSTLSILALAIDSASAAEARTFAASVSGQSIAAIVYAQNKAAEPFLKNAQSRLESTLTDNGITVLDRSRADALRTAAPTLEDPGGFVTAEWFVENAGKFEIKGLLTLYLSADSTPGLADYHSATAHADIRFISETDARVSALTTTPMGAPGSPPSDGLTADSALINAVQRAIDNACGKMGMQLMDPVRPRAVKLDLQGPIQAQVAAKDLPMSDPKKLAAAAKLEKAKWRAEDPTAAAHAPAGKLAALGGYIVDTDFHRQPPRFYGSRVHLVDLESNRELMTFDCHPVGKKDPGEKGDRKILACAFVASWRYLAAVTGSSLFFWDTERGQLMTKIDLPNGIASGTLGLASDGTANYLVVKESGRRQHVFKIARGQ